MVEPVLTVFGISGRTGRALVKAAERKWQIRGYVRDGSEVPGVELIRGSLDDSERVRDAVAGAAAVCCVFGQRQPYLDVFCEAATRTIVEAMGTVGCNRLICQTGAMIGSGQGLRRSRLFAWMARSFARRYPAIAQDRAGQERVVMESELRWTIVKPPRLTDKPAKKRVRAGPDIKVGLLSRVSRAELAAFLLREAESGWFVRCRVVVKR